MWIEPSKHIHRAPSAAMAAAVTFALMFAPSAVLGQQRTIYDSRTGKVIGRTATDSQGSTTLYGPAGRVTGRTSTGSDGTVTVYGSDGRRAGSVTAPPAPKSK